MKICSVLAGALAVVLFSGCASTKNIVIIAGKPSHPAGMHEFRAGSLLLQKCLSDVKGVSVTVYSNGWPDVSNALDKADAVVIYADGGGGNPAIQGDHKQVLNRLAKKGVGLGFMHYAVEVPETNGGGEFNYWIGGYYADRYSVNPIWSPEFKTFPKHPIAKGVQPFSTRDEWYFNLKFMFNTVDGSRLLGLLGLAPPVPMPILVAKPSDEVRKGPYVYPRGPYPHVVAQSGRDEVMMWAWERSGGGRGFGFTGGHTHANWGNENQRKVVLNALLWIAKAKVPANGVDSVVSPEDLQQNLDPKKK